MDESSDLPDTGAEVRYVPLATVVAWGELDVSTVSQLQTAIDTVLDSDGSRTIEIDLGGVTFIDSSGLGVLVAGLKRANTLGGTLVIQGLQPAPRKVFEITGLLELFGAA